MHIVLLLCIRHKPEKQVLYHLRASSSLLKMNSKFRLVWSWSEDQWEKTQSTSGPAREKKQHNITVNPRNCYWHVPVELDPFMIAHMQSYWAEHNRRWWGSRAQEQIVIYLNQVVEYPKSFRIFAALDIKQGANLRRGERDMVIAHDYLQLLPPNSVWLRPVVVIFLQYLHKTDPSLRKSW